MGFKQEDHPMDNRYTTQQAANGMYQVCDEAQDGRAIHERGTRTDADALRDYLEARERRHIEAVNATARWAHDLRVARGARG